jgi:opacity protein-like surface antigen
MNFKVLVLSAMVMFSGTALAQTAPTTGVYVGAAVGTTMQTNSDVTTGVVLGYRFNRVLGAEVTYDREWRAGQNGGLLMLNGVAELPVHNRVRPYVLAGVGLGFDHYNQNGADRNGTPMYNVGGGVRVALTTNVDLDARYRYFAPVNTGDAQRDASMLTLGVNYRF